MGVHSEAAHRVASIEALDLANARLARGHGRVRIRLGRAAEVLATSGAYKELGFADTRSFSLERLGRSGAWFDESRRVARRLAALPRIEAALSRGQITWKMAELLARYATADDEEAILTAARRSTVREMSEVLRDCAAARAGAEEDEEGERMCTVVRQVPVEVLGDCLATQKIVEHLEGREMGDGWIGPVLAEATSTLQNVGVDPVIEEVGEACESLLARRREATERRERVEAAAERAAEMGGAPMWRVGDLELGEEVDEQEPIPTDPKALEAMMRRLMKQLSSRDLWLGGSLDRFFREDGWKVLGYASFDQYIRERLGMARSVVWQKIRLWRESIRLPELGEAVRRGSLEQEAATLVAGVASAETVKAWIERAARRTYKHVREEVEVARTVARLEGRRLCDGPPDEETVEAFFRYEREVLSGERVREALRDGGPVRMCEVAADAVRMCEEGEGAVRMCEGTGRREIRLRVPEEVFVQFRMMEVAYAREGLEGEFLSFLCRQFWWVWAPTLGKSDKWEAIYRRDRYRCSCPVCFRRDVTLHHLRYRLAGGGDEEENLSSICFFHHLEGEHGGRLKVTGPASRMRWELGRRGRPPVLVVEGREKIAS